jgi:ClpP class serine protease
MRESLLFVSLRSFLIAFFSILGVCVGFFLMMAFFSKAVSTKEELESKFSVEILPNADGIRKSLSKSAPAILQLNIVGEIGSEKLNMQKIRQMLVESREDDLGSRIKALIVKIESPGGTVVDAEGIYSAI